MNRGITFIELLIVVAIILTLGIMSVSFYARFLTQNSVDNTVTKLVQSFRKAQVYSMTGRQNGVWGVNYSSNNITLFQGNTFATRNTAFDESFNVNNNITISGFTTDITFARVTGLPNSTANITISGGNSSKIVTINSQGVASKTTAFIPLPTPIPTIPPSGTVVLKSTTITPEGKVYNLGVTCQGIPERTVDLRERTPAVPSKGAIFFTGGGWSTDYYELSDNFNIVGYADSEGFQTYSLKWTGVEGWGTGAGDAGYKKAMCGYAAIVKWVKDNGIATNSNVMCATGNSAGSFQIAFGLSVYGLEDYLDMVILTGGPPISRLDIGCFPSDPPHPAYWPVGLWGRGTTDYMLGYVPVRSDTTGPCVKSDGSNPAVVLDFQNESLASPSLTEFRDYDFPGTKVNFVNSLADDTVADEQGKIYRDLISSQKMWYDIPGTVHNVYSTLNGSNKIKELLSLECKAL